MIEEIYEIEIETLKTLKNKPVENILIATLPQSILNDEQILTFKKNLRRPNLSFKEQNNFRNNIFKKLSDDMLFENYPLYFSLFFDKNTTILDYIYKDSSIHIYNQEASVNDFEFTLEEMERIYKENLEDTDSDLILPQVNQVFERNLSLGDFKFCLINDLKIQNNFNEELSNKIFH